MSRKSISRIMVNSKRVESGSIEGGETFQPNDFQALVKCCLIVFVVSFIARFAYSIRTEPLISDQYWEISQSLITTGDYAVHPPAPLDKLHYFNAYYEPDKPTACRSPVTPIFLAICCLIFDEPKTPIRLLSVFFGSCSSVLVLLTLRKIGASLKTAMLGASIWSFWPAAVIYSTYSFLSEPISQLLVVLILFTMAPEPERPNFRPVFLGLLFGLLILNRSEYVIMILAMCVYTFVFLGYRARLLLTALAVCGLVVSPWVIRNYFVLGTPKLSTNDGLTLYLGNNPVARGSYSGDYVSSKRMSDAPSMQWVAEKYPDIWDVGEVERSKYFRKAAVDYIMYTLKSDRGHFFWLFKRKFMVFWYALDDSRFQSTPDYLLAQAMLFTFAVSLLTFPSKRTLYLAVPLLSYLVVALIFYSSSRNRFPYESGMIMFIVMQWEWFCRWLRDLLAARSKKSTTIVRP